MDGHIGHVATLFHHRNIDPNIYSLSKYRIYGLYPLIAWARSVTACQERAQLKAEIVVMLIDVLLMLIHCCIIEILINT